MLEGVLGAGRHGQRGLDPRLPARRQDRHREQARPGQTGGYSDTKFVASFIGFAPARDPRLLVAVMVDEPQGEHYGATVAAPAFQQIAASRCPTWASRRADPGRVAIRRHTAAAMSR